MQLFEGRLMDIDRATQLLLGLLRTPGINKNLGQPTMRVGQIMPTVELLW